MNGTATLTKETKPRVKRQSPEVRRQDLLAVTVSCLANLGPKGTTGREICRQAGVSHGLLRHYFRNPDNLLLETYEQLCDQLIAHLEAETKPFESDPAEALHRFFVAAFSERWASPDVIGAWMVFWQLVRSRDDFAAVSASYNRRQRALLEGLVRLLPPTERLLPLADAVAILSAVLDGLWIEFYLSEERTPAELCVRLCDQVVIQLFKPNAVANPETDQVCA
jgi:TetR/AcrR family transcriptional regulator, transcriptional repressor of bet genes